MSFYKCKICNSTTSSVQRHAFLCLITGCSHIEAVLERTPLSEMWRVRYVLDNTIICTVRYFPSDADGLEGRPFSVFCYSNYGPTQNVLMAGSIYYALRKTRYVLEDYL